ncbi:hypothetical protein ElyMa_004780300 [Elysia marginata]|uniref:Uncharacterized protein n=1 Tax=Elysia marginata TaxID=1093978 RepID=A0AAV4II93_9GAST|nr:hypothetical protein ElyMa_004780300 [Elysia marginata]
MIPKSTNKPSLAASAIHTPAESHPLHQTLALKYKHLMDEEEITVTRIPPDIPEHQQKQALGLHLKSVVGIFLSKTRAGQQDFVIHGGIALTIHMLNQVSAETIQQVEQDNDTPTKFRFPVLEEQQLDIDLVCNRTDPGIEALIRLLKDSLGNYEGICHITADRSPRNINIILDDATLPPLERFLIGGLTQTITATYNDEIVLTLDITYPPIDEPSSELEYRRPYCKQSEPMTVKLGESNVVVNSSTLKQSLDDLLCSFRNTNYLPANQNKFFHRIKTIIKLSYEKKLLLDDHDILDILLYSFTIKDKEQKLVKSSFQQTISPDTKSQKTNTEASAAAKLKSKEVQATQKYKDKKLMAVPESTSLYAQTDLSIPCDTEKKTYSDKAVQTILHDPIEIPPSTKPKATFSKPRSQECSARSVTQSKSTTPKTDALKARSHKEIQTDLEKIVFEKMKEKISATGKKRIYQQLKHLLDITDLLHLYSELLSNVTLEEYITTMELDNYIDIFENKPDQLLKQLQLLGSKIDRLENTELYETAALLYLSHIELYNIRRNAKTAHYNAILVNQTNKLRIELQTIDAEYFEAICLATRWLMLSGEEISDYKAQLKALTEALVCRYKDFLAIYPYNFRLLCDHPHALVYLRTVLIRLTGNPYDELMLEHIDLCIRRKKYRETQQKAKALPYADDLKEILYSIRNPLSHCAKLQELPKLAYTEGLYDYAGTLMVAHLTMMADIPEYLQECHKTGFFQATGTCDILNIYSALTHHPLDTENMDEQTISRAYKDTLLQFDLMKASNKLKPLHLEEWGSLKITDPNHHLRLDHWHELLSSLQKKNESPLDTVPEAATALLK